MSTGFTQLVKQLGHDVLIFNLNVLMYTTTNPMMENMSLAQSFWTSTQEPRMLSNLHLTDGFSILITSFADNPEQEKTGQRDTAPKDLLFLVRSLMSCE